IAPCKPCMFCGTPPTDFYSLSLHDALPISLARPHLCHHRTSTRRRHGRVRGRNIRRIDQRFSTRPSASERVLLAVCRHRTRRSRSEEHTSELQSPYDLVCRLLLEKKKSTQYLDSQATADPALPPAPARRPPTLADRHRLPPPDHPDDSRAAMHCTSHPCARLQSVP